MKTKTPDLFTATVHQILRAAKDEGATVKVATDSFLRALESVYGPNLLSSSAAKLSWRRTARAMSKSKEVWSDLDHEALARVRRGIAEAGAGQTHDHGSFARYAGAAPQHRRLAAAVDARIAHFKRCRSLLRYVTDDVLDAGLHLFSSEDGLVGWLSEPARALNGKIPLQVIQRPKGRAQVINVLRALEHGVVL